MLWLLNYIGVKQWSIHFRLWSWWLLFHAGYHHFPDPSKLDDHATSEWCISKTLKLLSVPSRPRSCSPANTRVLPKTIAIAISNNDKTTKQKKSNLDIDVHLNQPFALHTAHFTLPLTSLINRRGMVKKNMKVARIVARGTDCGELFILNLKCRLKQQRL